MRTTCAVLMLLATTTLSTAFLPEASALCQTQTVVLDNGTIVIHYNVPAGPPGPFTCETSVFVCIEGGPCETLP